MTLLDWLAGLSLAQVSPSLFTFIQNDTVCLPLGLACYKNEMKLTQDSCTIPCKGSYADVGYGGVEDIQTMENFHQFWEKYKEYKSGFNKDQGEHYCSPIVSN